jgi:hypothetical protein
MAGTSEATRISLLAGAALAMMSACADVHAPVGPPERGDGNVPTQTIDETIQDYRAGGQRARPGLAHEPPARMNRPGTRGSSSPPPPPVPLSPSRPYTGIAPGLPSIPMRPDATTIPTPGYTTFPLPGGTTIPTPSDPLSPNPATVTFPPLNR